jgi:hypothetical protein
MILRQRAMEMMCRFDRAYTLSRQNSVKLEIVFRWREGSVLNFHHGLKPVANNISSLTGLSYPNKKLTAVLNVSL